MGTLVGQPTKSSSERDWGEVGGRGGEQLRDERVKGIMDERVKGIMGGVALDLRV